MQSYDETQQPTTTQPATFSVGELEIAQPIETDLTEVQAAKISLNLQEDQESVKSYPGKIARAVTPHIDKSNSR